MIAATAHHNLDRQLVHYANEVVNQVFYGTLMREFRQGQEPTIFDKGPGGQTFIRQLDMELIKRISQRGESPLTEALLKQLSPSGASPMSDIQGKQQHPVSQTEQENISVSGE